MTKDTNNFADIDTKELFKQLAESESKKRELLFELQSGKQTAHNGYRQARIKIARIKTELAKHG